MFLTPIAIRPANPAAVIGVDDASNPYPTAVKAGRSRTVFIAVVHTLARLYVFSTFLILRLVEMSFSFMFETLLSTVD
jgi:hypothetical protein